MPPPGDTAPRWSPDGSRIAFFTARGGAALAVVNADGSSETRLLEGPYATWSLSPDWKRVAELRAGSLLVDGQVVVRDAQAFAWAPDSARLAFGRAGGLFVVGVDGSGLVRVAARGALPVWSPGGDWIAYTTGATEDLDVHVVRADGAADVNLTRGDRRTNLRPLWSPTGRSIAFVTSDGRRVQAFCGRRMACASRSPPAGSAATGGACTSHAPTEPPRDGSRTTAGSGAPPAPTVSSVPISPTFSSASAATTGSRPATLGTWATPSWAVQGPTSCVATIGRTRSKAAAATTEFSADRPVTC